MQLDDSEFERILLFRDVYRTGDGRRISITLGQRNGKNYQKASDGKWMPVSNLQAADDLVFRVLDGKYEVVR